MLYGADYYPEHRDENMWEYDLQNMNKANINALRIVEFAWKRLEPKKGVYDFEWVSRFIRLAKKYNIKIVLCPPVRTVPAYMIEEDNTLAILTEDNYRLEYGSRYSFCINHPYLKERALKLTYELVNKFKDYENVIGFHLDNEYGDEPYCHCNYCKEKWHRWLEKKYESIDVLNKEWGNVFWGLEYDNFNQIPTTKKTKVGFSPAHFNNYCEFRSDCTIEFIKNQKDIVKELTDKFVSTNNQPLWNNKTNYYKMAQELDVCGTNYYPPYEDYRVIEMGLAAVRSYKEGKPYYVFELKNGPHMKARDNEYSKGDVEKLVAHCISNGADGTFFFRWRACPFGYEQNHGTITSYNGQPLNIYEEVKALGEKIKA